MLYRFSMTENRRVQWANYLQLQSSRVHEMRTLDVHDLIYMVDGEWELALGKESYLMKPNDLLIFPAGMTHRGTSPCTPNTKIFYLHIYPENGDGTNDSTYDAGDSLLLDNFISTENFPHIKVLFERLVQIKNAPVVSTAYVNTLLYELSSITQNKDDSLLARQIRDYLLHSAHIPLNSEVADHFYLGQRTVENIFKQTYGMTMHQYAIDHKLKCVKQYLKDYPNITLYEIANMLGFCDEHHLSRMFKRSFGISPRDYKKLQSPQ